MFTIPSFASARKSGTPIVMMTCYDAPGAAALEGSKVDVVLVGDSVAMVVHGHDSTLTAHLDMMESHVRAVRAGGPGLCIVADMPFLSTRTGLADAVRAAGRLMQAGANAVKIEGLDGHEDIIPHLVASGIPVMGHLGLQPQSVNVYGSYKVQGKTVDQAQHILDQARRLEELGCFSLVLECVPPDVAASVTAGIGIATIGIGAGSACSGQVLVWHDVLGMPVHPGTKTARFVRRYAGLHETIRAAADAWASDVKESRFPGPQETFAPLGLEGSAASSGGHSADGARPFSGVRPADSTMLYGSPAGSAANTGSAGRLPPGAARMQSGLPVFEDPLAWRAWCRSLRASGSIGFVPTMGALHEGHASLVRRAASENTHRLVSIFVNPTQFNDPKDFAAYPRTEEADCALLAAAGATGVFLPGPDTMYPDKYAYKVIEKDLSGLYCGAFRPGHFDGVLTVVMKLLQLAGADRAYFGEKDWQQYLLIRGMAEAYFLDTQIVPCPTVREKSGLAMSSRNTRLSAGGLDAATAIYRAISGAPDTAAAKAQLEALGFRVEYVEDRPDPWKGTVRRLAAAWLEGVRLIDNVELAGKDPT